MFAKGNVDPELERLRQEVDGPPNLDTVALNIQRATARIHASYLFEHIGKPTLQKLCLLLSSTATEKTYSGWQEFAAHMGLTMEQIRCIDYDFKGLQDPTYYVLLTYVQHVGATMDKILGALQKMHRFDVINQIKDSIFDLINGISQNTIVDESTILRSKTIPRAPLVLTPMNVTQEVQMRNTASGLVSQNSLQKTKQMYGCIVMLTFADDGLETAQHITKIFRSKEPRIGVVILQEQENYVYSRAEEFIDDCFKQVNFIIPILTQGYMEKLNNPKISIEDQNRLDTKYIKYIYSFLRYEYVRNQCINCRVRCIVPDKEISTVIRANMHPTLQAWFRESNIDEFVENILLLKYSNVSTASIFGNITPFAVTNTCPLKSLKHLEESNSLCGEAREKTIFPRSPWTHCAPNSTTLSAENIETYLGIKIMSKQIFVTSCLVLETSPVSYETLIAKRIILHTKFYRVYPASNSILPFENFHIF